MATLRDIANEAGVSIRTVTRALSGSGYVRADLRAQILDIAELRGYRPDPLAQSLRLGRTRQIIVVSRSVDELHMAKIAALERYVRPAGYGVSVLMATPEELGSAGLLPELLARKPAGVALIGSVDLDVTPLAGKLYESGVPCIGIDTRSAYPGVLIDRPAGVAQATRHLISSGRQRIVYVGPNDSASRIEGFRQALTEGEREVRLYDPGDGRSRATTVPGLLAEHPDVDAIQAYSDEWALEILAGLHERGIRVPGDIALVGFDDRWAAAHSWPALTTVAQPGDQIGAAVAELLTGASRERLGPLLGHDEQPGALRRLSSELTRSIPTELVVRESA